MVKLRIEDLKKTPEADLVVNNIVDRRRKGLYSLLLVHGLPGSGKSSLCFRIKEKTEDKFRDENGNLKINVQFRIIEKLHELACFTQDAKEEDLCIGIIEELSTLFPARRAMAGENVDVIKILDTCRKKKVIILANSPIWTAIDSHIRMMGTTYIETIKVYKQAGMVISRFFRLQTNPQTGKTYTHSFLRNRKEITRMYTLMPNLDVWREYESKKDAFMDNLYTKIKKRAEKREEKENKELGIVNKIRQVQTRPLTKKEIEAHELVNIQGLTQTEAARKLGVSKVCIHNRMNSINRKTQIIMKPLIVNNKTPARSKLIDRSMIENFPSQEKGLNSSNSIDNNVQKEV